MSAASFNTLALILVIVISRLLALEKGVQRDGTLPVLVQSESKAH
jgi:hypothetical protein